MTDAFQDGFTRRALVKAMSGAGLAGLGTGVGLLGGVAPANAVPAFDAYHGVSDATHRANIARLKTDYRMISLSIYGDPAAPLYAAVWVRRSGPAWAEVHGLGAGAYQAAFTNWTGQGYVPTIVAATGPRANAVFAAVFEQGVGGGFRARHDISETDFIDENKKAKAAQQRLRWAGIYGTPGDRRYIAVWHANAGNVKWRSFDKVAAVDFQRVFDIQTQIPNFRLASIAVASDGALCPLFKDDSVGDWSARTGMSTSDYQNEFNRQVAAGRMPICLQGGGVGNGVRYAAIFAGREQTIPRTFSIAGPITNSLFPCEDLVVKFMKTHGVRAAQLTVAKNGTTKLQRGYTWAEPAYKLTQTSDRFLLASNSKMFVAAAIQKLFDTNRLQSTSLAYRVLGLANPADPASDKITVQQLLDHTAGYTYDPTYNMRTVAVTRGLIGPPSMRDVALFMYYDRTVDIPPGTYHYNNYGYLLLSLLVEVVTQQNYLQFVRTQLLQPSGITEVEGYPTAATPRSANLVEADDSGYGLPALHPNRNVSVPSVYGGDGMVKEVAIGSCGVAASATALTQFIQSHAAWGNGGRRISARAGSTPGASTWAQSQAGDIDWALVLNGRQWTVSGEKPFTDLTSAISTELANAAF